MNDEPNIVTIKDLAQYIQKVKELMDVGNLLADKLAEQHRSHGLCSSYRLAKQWRILVKDIQL